MSYTSASGNSTMITIFNSVDNSYQSIQATRYLGKRSKGSFLSPSKNFSMKKRWASAILFGSLCVYKTKQQSRASNTGSR